MVDKPLTILQVNSSDILGGGAERISWGLFEAYQSLGLQSWLAVGTKKSNDPNVVVIPNNLAHNRWVRFWRAAGDKLTPQVAHIRGAWQLQTLLYGIGEPERWLNIQRGYEDFNFPGTYQLLDLLAECPDIVHCHNLHGEYFDLHALPWLSQQIPLVLTLHDMWLLTGHCAYSLDCERWQAGCGHCPYLTIYPSIIRDGTVYNWERKQNIYRRSRLYITTPSQWLMQQVEKSMLAVAVEDARVIPNGVDLSVFHPREKQVVRAELGIPPNVKMLLFVAKNLRAVWKDYETIYAAIKQASKIFQQQILFVALGEDASLQQSGQALIRHVPYQKNASDVARYYQAADVYLHAAYVDTFPTTILEALACGTPVIATAVGGIPEQVKSLLPLQESNLNSYPAHEATGVLTPSQDPQSMALAIKLLLEDETLCSQLAENAARDARQRFGLDQHVDAYLTWYQEVIELYNRKKQQSSLVYEA